MSLEAFLRDVAGVRPPARLAALSMFLAGGAAPVRDPGDRRGLHPLVIPLAGDEKGTLGLLRWPTALEELPLPVVRVDGRGMVLVARSVDEWLHRELATRDARGEGVGALLDAANRPGRLYEVGDVARTGLPLPAFLLLKVGVNHEFHEELAEKHLERGDAVAALVTADRSCRVATGWARPHAYRAHLFARLERHEEAAEAARLALIEPVWTLGMPFSPVARRAGWKEPITSVSYRRLASSADKLPLDRAAHLLDAAAVDGTPWDDVRDEIAACYAEAGLAGVARFVRA